MSGGGGGPKGREGRQSEANGREDSARAGPRSPGSRLGGRRSQLVLVAAGVAAVGLLPVVVAYTQLGYAGVATTTPSAETPTNDVVGTLERAAFAASADSQARSSWSEREAVADDVAVLFDERAAAIETAGVEHERVHEIDRNASAAAAVGSGECPGGPARQFGDCVAIEGIVLQERGGDTHVVAIAVDVRTVAEAATFEGTYGLDAETGGRVPT